MSYNRTFSQPAFWDFVASLRGRNNSNEPAYEALYSGAPAWGGPRAGRRGLGRRNRMNLAASSMAMEGTPSALPGEANEEGMPPAYPMETGTIPVTYENEKAAAMGPTGPVNDGKQRGFGRFHKLRMRLRDQGLSEDEISARIEKRHARRAALANGEGNAQGPRARRIMRLREQGFSEEEIAARFEKRRALRAARANGEGKFEGPRARRIMRLREQGLSEEEIAARFEKRRALRAARANGEGKFQGSRARRMRDLLIEEDPLTPVGVTGSVAQQAVPRPRRRGCGYRNGVNASEANATEANATEANATEDSANNAAFASSGRRGGFRGRGGRRGCGGRGGRCMHERPIRLEDITRGGPAKFAGRFGPQGANPSNGNIQQGGPAQDGCPACGNRGLAPTPGPQNRPGMLHGMRGLAINDSSDETDATADSAMHTRQLAKTNKKNKGDGSQKVHGKTFKPRADVFSTAGSYIIHIALPGAKQENVGVTWEPKKSAIRVAGLLERPPAEELGKECTLVRGQRAVGSFDRLVKLGKKGSKVKVYENGITALLEDGILNVEVPKYDGVENDDGFVEINEKV